MHGVAYDAVHDEFMIPQQFGQAIMTYRGSANGEEPPIRIIQGPHTRLKAPCHLDLDTVHDEIYVPEKGYVLVFPRGAHDDVAPIAVDPVHNLLIVGSSREGESRLLIFNRTDSGNVKPKAVIGGPKSRLHAFGGPFAAYPPKGEIIVSVRGAGPDADMSSDEAYVGIWSIEDNGDVPARRTIGGPKGVLRMPRGIALDIKNENMMVSDKRLNAVLTFHFPELF